jgi:hypothetical protein
MLGNIIQADRHGCPYTDCTNNHKNENKHKKLIQVEPSSCLARCQWHHGNRHQRRTHYDLPLAVAFDHGLGLQRVLQGLLGALVKSNTHIGKIDEQQSSMSA